MNDVDRTVAAPPVAPSGLAADGSGGTTSAGPVWNDSRHALGVAEMDATHREFAALVAALVSCADTDFPARFQALHDHTRSHFAAEDARMRATRFPALGEHLGEHQRVLAELRAFNRSVQAGRLHMARAYVRESLPGWFDLHLATMDSALAAHLKKLAR